MSCNGQHLLCHFRLCERNKESAEVQYNIHKLYMYW